MMAKTRYKTTKIAVVYSMIHRVKVNVDIGV
jgi:hypothetical protein